jgi:hypothetical protein
MYLKAVHIPQQVSLYILYGAIVHRLSPRTEFLSDFFLPVWNIFRMDISPVLGLELYLLIVIWNRHGFECSRIWKLSGNFIKKCRDFLGRDILGTTFFRELVLLILIFFNLLNLFWHTDKNFCFYAEVNFGDFVRNDNWLLLHTGSGFKWYRTYERGYETSGSHLRFMLRRSSIVECVSVLHGTCLQSVEFFFIRQYVQPCLSKNPKYTFYTIKSSMTLA